MVHIYGELLGMVTRRDLSIWLHSTSLATSYCRQASKQGKHISSSINEDEVIYSSDEFH